LGLGIFGTQKEEWAYIKLVPRWIKVKQKSGFTQIFSFQRKGEGLKLEGPKVIW